MSLTLCAARRWATVMFAHSSDFSHAMQYVRRQASPPSRGRGSKPVESGTEIIAGDVAPLTGAWIETTAQP